MQSTDTKIFTVHAPFSFVEWLQKQ